jgi:ABC-2 type transport system ATP-binding protein
LQTVRAPTHAIELAGLTLRFAAVTAVDHVDLCVDYGVIFGLLGANGAGKSTTIKMLTTLLRPTSGAAMVDGLDVVRSPVAVRRRLGYVPQMLSSDGALTGRENLRLSARLYDIPRAETEQRIREGLQRMGLEDSADRLVKTYSGGMIRRLELAQATLHLPKVLFLDEPTIGLDPVARHVVWEHLLELKRRLAMTMLLTTHDMEEADHLCDQLAILHRGRVMVTGSPRELKARLGPHATLDDVFSHFSGDSDRSGRFHDISETRRVAQRLG